MLIFTLHVWYAWIKPEVVHNFMCENVVFKQKFLLSAYQDNSRLFSEATQLFTGERKCIRHNDTCETWLDSDGVWDWIWFLNIL